MISGLGADRSVFDRIDFPAHLEVVFIDWLIPEFGESFSNYVDRMRQNIDANEEFYLLGYSFGGIIAQEIHKKTPAKKMIILGSIKSEKGFSPLMNFGKTTRLYNMVPTSFFNEKSYGFYAFARKLFDPKNPNLMNYFRVRDPYYLKWSITQILQWRGEETLDAVQVLADKDIVFPIAKSHPDYVIKNATHLFPVTKAKEVSEILAKELK